MPVGQPDHGMFEAEGAAEDVSAGIIITLPGYHPNLNLAGLG